jgi:hypothetical protein
MYGGFEVVIEEFEMLSDVRAACRVVIGDSHRSHRSDQTMESGTERMKRNERS